MRTFYTCKIYFIPHLRTLKRYLSVTTYFSNQLVKIAQNRQFRHFLIDFVRHTLATCDLFIRAREYSTVTRATKNKRVISVSLDFSALRHNTVIRN